MEIIKVPRLLIVKRVDSKHHLPTRIYQATITMGLRLGLQPTLAMRATIIVGSRKRQARSRCNLTMQQS